MVLKTPEQVAADELDAYAENLTPDEQAQFNADRPRLAYHMAAAVEADRAQRPAVPDRLVVTSADGARTWIGGDTLAGLLDTINGYLDDGYTPEELRIEEITR